MKRLTTYKAPVLKNYYLTHGYELKKRKHNLADQRLFEIQTLSDRVYPRLGDLIPILTAGVGFLTQMFPSIFGGNRKILTEADWMALVPGNGYITARLRTYLASVIRYDTDVKRIAPSGKTNLEAQTIYFAQHYSLDWCPDGSCQGNSESVLMPKFYSLLRKEAAGQGQQGNVPGFMQAGFDFAKALPYLAVGVLALLILNKKKSRKK